MRNKYAVYVFIGVCAIALILASSERVKDRVALRFDRTASHAFTLGTHHLDTTNRDEYNIDEAMYFFQEAASIDPSYPLVHHQIARIYFLQGRYSQALESVNKELANNPQGTFASSYYLRGLIAGYMQDYDSAVRDYKKYVELNPSGWEGRVDYAWVLIKTKDYKTALDTIDDGLIAWPENPWLLSVRATTLFEMGRLEEAHATVRAAALAAEGITPEIWLRAYPGNNPDAAAVGIETIRSSIAKNVDSIERAVRTSSTPSKREISR